MRCTTVLGIAGMLLGACAFDTDEGVQATKSEIQVVNLQTGEFIAGSEARLVRDDDSISTKVETFELPASSDMFVVWAIFNDATACTNGNPVTGSPCGPADLGVDATGASVLFYDFRNTSDEEEFRLEDAVAVGDTSACLDGLPCREGLTNPASAEIHVVIIENETGAFLQGAQFIP